MPLAGVAAALALLEVRCFALFAPGGRFHYQGFGDGALMFANITLQIVAYGLLATLLVPLGYGHLRLRPWSRTLMSAALLAWLALGLPLAVMALALLYAQKNVSLATGLAAAALAVLTYPAAPLMLLRLYRSRVLARLLDVAGQATDWSHSARGLAAALLLIIGCACWAVPALFRGLAPLLTSWLTGPVALALDIACGVGNCGLAWALAGRRWARFASWACGRLPAVGFHAGAHAMGRVRRPLRLPALEAVIGDRAALHGAHLAVLVALPTVPRWRSYGAVALPSLSQLLVRPLRQSQKACARLVVQPPWAVQSSSTPRWPPACGWRPDAPPCP